MPSETQLLLALESYYQLQLESELSEFDTQQKMKWLKYLPTLGITYTLDGKPRPAISWSSNLLYSHQKDKSYSIAKKQFIYKKNQLELEKEKLHLHNLLRRYYFLQQDILILHNLFEYDFQLYQIQKDQADHIQIPPSELLKATQTIKQKEYNLFQKNIVAPFQSELSTTNALSLIHISEPTRPY